MSRPEILRAHAILLRARAAVLMRGDTDAQLRACELETEADSIDPQRAKQEEES